jgi:radical SAM protein with 4Fe4S-binding SPASM domain
VREGIDEALDREIEAFVGKKPLPLHPVAFLEHRYQTLVRRFRRTGRSPLPCMALSSSVFIDPFWTVFPCSMFEEPVGNLRENGFDLGAIWNSPKARRTLRTVEEEKCPHCWTPCEAYQTVLGNLTPWRRIRNALRGRRSIRPDAAPRLGSAPEPEPS